jgi:hypothetical protein
MREHHLQRAARRCGLKIVLWRRGAVAPGGARFLLRPIWDARRAVRIGPDGRHDLVHVAGSGKRAPTLFTADALDDVLATWGGQQPFAPAQLPWQAGVVDATLPTPEVGCD